MTPATPLTRAHRPSAAERAAILGAITGHAQVIDEAIEAAAVSKLMRKLLHKAKRAAFNTAGFQQISRHAFMRAEPGIWCECHSAEWARELGIRLPYLCELRGQAERLGIWTYKPNPEAGTAWNEPDGFIRWNTDLSAWAPLSPEYRQARYSRPGAGRPPKEIEADTADAAEESKVIRTPASSAESKVKRGESKVKQGVIKSETAASFGPGNYAASAGAVRMVEESEETTTAANAGARARASEAPAEGTPKPADRPLIPWIARMHPDDQREAWAIIEALQAIPDWPGGRTGKLNTAADAQAIHTLLRDPADRNGCGIPMPWLAHQVRIYAAFGDEDQPVKHDRKGFIAWCTNPKAMADLQRWLSNPWPLHVSPTTVTAAAPAASSNRQGATDGRRWSAARSARTDQRPGSSGASRPRMAGQGEGDHYEFG